MAESLPGLVISHWGKTLAVEGPGGVVVECHARRRVGDLAVGDRVLWEPGEPGHGVIRELLSRHSLLVRPGRGGGLRNVVANVDRVWVVLAPEPEPDFLLVDQILATCEYRVIDAGLVRNKMDLGAGPNDLDSGLQEYHAIGYPVVPVSAATGAGLADLRAWLDAGCSMLAGQSGVGKSSLTNALLPDRLLRTSELSRKGSLGRHTTTTATLYHLPGGGDLIDSPGVAVFGLAEMRPQDVAVGFREFRGFLEQCRFNDCRHVDDKDCAVRHAAERGEISGRRYQRYRRLVARTAAGAAFSGLHGW